MLLKLRTLWLLPVVALWMALAGACAHDQAELPIAESEHTLYLRWPQSYPGETHRQVETGLKWTLSFLGAELREGSFDRAIAWNGDRLTLRLDRVGFSDNALAAVSELLRVIRQSKEYTQTQGIDIGRFVMLTLNASNHYYAITGMPKTLSAFETVKAFDPVEAAIIESSVAYSHRAVRVPDTLSANTAWAFIAQEGAGSLEDGSFVLAEYEVLDLMPNGQFRFALYSPAGDLLTHGDSTLGQAGKPAKCLWCHEIGLQEAYLAKTKVPGYHHPGIFGSIIRNRTQALDNYRGTLNGDIDFTQNQEHTQSELLYITFMEPSAMRLALEWNTTETEVKELLKGLPTHTHPEFSFLGELYNRSDVEPFAPYEGIRISDAPREPSEYEPDLIP